MLSIGAFHVSVLTRAQYFEDAVRMQGWSAFFFSIAAAISASIVVPIAVYHIRDMAQNPAQPLTWLFMGAGFGVTTPLLTGGFSRLAIAFAGIAEGQTSFGKFLSQLVDAVIVFPYDMVVQGATNLYAGLLSAAFFAIIGYLIDRANASKSETTSTYAPWLLTIGLGLPVLLFALLGPAEFLRDIAR